MSAIMKRMQYTTSLNLKITVTFSEMNMMTNMINPLSASDALIANQLTGLYMRATLTLNGLMII